MPSPDTKELIEVLNKCWMTHDAMWFYHCFRELGISEANRLNHAAIRALAPIEVNRIRAFLGMEPGPITGSPAFQRFFSGASDLCIPDFMNVAMTFPRDNVLHWEFKPGACFAYKGMQRMGALAGYECGVLYRIACWIESLGIRYRVQPEVKTCLMLENGTCSGDFTLDFSSR